MEKIHVQRNLEADGKVTCKYPLYVHTVHCIQYFFVTLFSINQCQCSVHPTLTKLYLYARIRTLIKQHYVHSSENFEEFQLLLSYGLRVYCSSERDIITQKTRIFCVFRLQLRCSEQRSSIQFAFNI